MVFSACTMFFRAIFSMAEMFCFVVPKLDAISSCERPSFRSRSTSICLSVRFVSRTAIERFWACMIYQDMDGSYAIHAKSFVCAGSPGATVTGLPSCTQAMFGSSGFTIPHNSKKRFFHKKSSKNCPLGGAGDILFRK